MEETTGNLEAQIFTALNKSQVKKQTTPLRTHTFLLLTSFKSLW